LEPEKPNPDLVGAPQGGVTTLLRPMKLGPRQSFRDAPIEEEPEPGIFPLPWIEPARQRLREAAGVGGVCVALVLAFALARRWRFASGLAACLLLPPLLALLVLTNADSKLFDAKAFPSQPDEQWSWQGWYMIEVWALSRWGSLKEGVIFNPVVWMCCWSSACLARELLRRIEVILPGAGWMALTFLALLVYKTGGVPDKYDFLGGVAWGVFVVFVAAFIWNAAVHGFERSKRS
jgi:hypothetical protein